MAWNKVQPVSELKKTIRKPQIEYTAPWYARKIMWRFSPYVTWSILHTNMTANQVTLLQNVFGFVGFVFLCCPSTGVAFLGVLMIQFGYLLDCVDGEVARYRNASSINGIYIDFFNHVTVIPLIPVGLGFHYYFLSGHSVFYPILGVLGGLFTMSPISLAAHETLIWLQENRRTPSYDYRKLKKAKVDGLWDQDNEERERVDLIKTFLKHVNRGWGNLAHYPGSMNVVSLLVVVELVLGKGSLPALLPLFSVYVLATVMRELLLFHRSVMNHEVEARHLRIHRWIREDDEIPKETGSREHS